MQIRRWLCGTTLVLLCVCAAVLPCRAETRGASCGSVYPGEVSFTEPATGLSCPIYNKGSEFFSYMTDVDGQLLVVDSEGYLRLVTEQDGAYQLGGYATGQNFALQTAGEAVTSATVSAEKYKALCSEIAAATPQLLAEDDPGEDASEEPVPGTRIGDIPLDYTYKGDAAEGRAKVCTTDEDMWLDDVSNYPAKEATCPLLVLKVEFNDIKATFNDDAWSARIFGNADIPAGISAYYTEVSNGKFTYVPVAETAGTENDGVITVTLPFNAPPYTIVDDTNQLVQNDPLAGLYLGTDGKDYAIYNTGSIFAYALLKAEEYIDFAAYDRNGDRYISPTELAVLVVYSGFEASCGGALAAQGKPAVWAHSWKFNNMLSDTEEDDCHYQTMTVDDVKFFKYTIIGELANYPGEYDYETDTGTPRQAQFGTATHELGHDLGLPDLYPTAGEALPEQVEFLSLMGTGNWGSALDEQTGSCPTHLDPYSKIYLGFYEETASSPDGRYTLYAAGNPKQYNILRINTDDPDVYYLLENRQDIGFDKGFESWYIEDSRLGIVVWRIDESDFDNSWRLNTVNNTDGAYGIMPVFAHISYQDQTTNWPFWASDSWESDLSALQELLNITFTSQSNLEAMTLEVLTPPVVFTPAGGVYPAAQRVTLSCEAEDAVIRYTTDGTEPTETSTEYHADTPIEVSSSTTIRAKAFREGFAPSATTQATYTITPPPSHSDSDSDSTPVLTIGAPKTEENITIVEVTVKTTVSGSTARVNLPAAAVEKAVESVVAAAEAENTAAAIEITVETPVSAAKVETTLPAKAMKTLAESGAALTVSTGIVTVSFDTATLNAVVSEQENRAMQLSIASVKSETLTQSQQTALGDQAQKAIILDLNLLVGASKISNLGGTVTVCVPCPKESSANPGDLAVWFLADDGAITPCQGAFNEKTGQYVFQTTHFSTYVLTEFPFTDVAQSAWYYGDVAYCRMNGLMNGTASSAFSPSAAASRGMIVTLLYRMEGEPAVTGANPFHDVTAGSYYENAITWAAANGIAGGYGNGSFCPDRSITREQLSAILWRYASYKGCDVSASADLSTFSDANRISTYARSPLSWANASGLIDGKGNGILDPHGNATRAQVAAILHRFCESFTK